MRPLSMLVVVVLGFGIAGAINPASSQLPQTAPQQNGIPTLAPLLKKVTPAVVNIAVKTRTAAAEQNPMLQDPFFRYFFDVPKQPEAPPRMSAGSGVIIDAAKGYVMTNHHVIANAEEISVTLKDRRRFKAKLIGSDKGTDIALLQIDGEKLTAVPLGNSDALEVGDFVLAIGNPFAIGQTVTSGIVSALGRTGLNIEGYEDFIQTDASINPGNSGGALINLKGELVGINTAIIAPGGGNVGIGFAVPVNMARAAMKQLLRYGEVRRGRMGVAIQDVTPDIAAALGLETNRGAIISRVDPKSPAEDAGLRAGDVVIALNGHGLRNSADLRNRVGLVRVGEDVRLGIIRNDKRIERKVKIGTSARLAATRRDGVPQLEGAVISDMDKEHSLSGKIEGVIVTRVDPGSPAWRGGLRKGDVIAGVNRRLTPNVDAFAKAVEGRSKVLAMNIIRDGAQIFLVLQ